VTSNEAVSEPAGEQAVEFQGMPQPRPALALVNGHRVVSCENYECFIGVSPYVYDLKKFNGIDLPQVVDDKERNNKIHPNKIHHTIDHIALLIESGP